METSITAPLLSITRPREWFGRFRKLRVVLDGATAAALRIGETVELRLEPGEHVLQLQMDWCTSRELRVNIKPGESLAFVTKSPMLWKAVKSMSTRPDSFFELLPKETLSR